MYAWLPTKRTGTSSEIVIIVITTVLALTLIIAAAVIIIASLLSKKTITDREKGSPFECGFDPRGSARLPFSLRFFLIAVIFLIFDVEITLILPLAFIVHTTNIISWSITGLFFIFVLLVGLYYEWHNGALEWAGWIYSQRWYLNCTQEVLPEGVKFKAGSEDLLSVSAWILVLNYPCLLVKAKERRITVNDINELYLF